MVRPAGALWSQFCPLKLLGIVEDAEMEDTAIQGPSSSYQHIPPLTLPIFSSRGALFHDLFILCLPQTHQRWVPQSSKVAPLAKITLRSQEHSQPSARAAISVLTPHLSLLLR